MWHIVGQFEADLFKAYFKELNLKGDLDLEYLIN